VKISQNGETIDVTEIQQLGAANADIFESAVFAALSAGPKKKKKKKKKKKEMLKEKE